MENKRLTSTLAAIDSINADDPNTTMLENSEQPNELIYGQRMSACLNSYWPEASEYLQIAVRAQHIKRWHLKRADFPAGKAGYLNWRKQLGIFHAELTKEIMIENNYSEEEGHQTYDIVRKAKLKSNQDSQTLEDVACLVFLLHYFAPFAEKHSDEKIIDIVKKTWKKMSDKGHEIALSHTLPEHLAKLVSQALA